MYHHLQQMKRFSSRNIDPDVEHEFLGRRISQKDEISSAEHDKRHQHRIRPISGGSIRSAPSSLSSLSSGHLISTTTRPSTSDSSLVQRISLNYSPIPTGNNDGLIVLDSAIPCDFVSLTTPVLSIRRLEQWYLLNGSNQREQRIMIEIMALEEDIQGFEMNGQYHIAAQKMTQILSLIKEIYGALHENVLQFRDRLAVACNRYATIYMQQNDLLEAKLEKRKAQECLHKAYELLLMANKFSPRSDSATTIIQYSEDIQRRSLIRALTLNNIGCYFRRKGESSYVNAWKYVMAAMDLEKKARKDNRASARSYVNACVILSQMEKHLEALEYAKIGLNILLDEELMTEDHRVLNNVGSIEKYDLYTALVVAHHNIAVQWKNLRQVSWWCMFICTRHRLILSVPKVR